MSGLTDHDAAVARDSVALARARAIEHAIRDRSNTRALPPEIAADKAAMDEIASGRRLEDTLQAAFGGVANEPIPREILGRLAGERDRLAGPLRFAASVALMLLAFGAGWWLRGGPEGAGPATTVRFTDNAHRAHEIYVAEQRHAVEVAASEDHLFRWLSARLGGDIVAPPLADHGFTLLGGRLLPEDDRVAAQFMYEDADGRRLTLYIAAFGSVQPTEVQVRAFEGSSAMYWTDGDFGFALIGGLPREELIGIAAAAHELLTGSDGPA